VAALCGSLLIWISWKYRPPLFLQVIAYLPDHHRVFDVSDHLDGAAAFAADLDVDSEHALETLRPGHRRPMFGGCWRFTRYFSLVPFAALGGRHQRAVFAVLRVSFK